MEITIRKERAADHETIRRLTEAAFEAVEESDGSEADILDALRADEALELSLVAVDETDQIFGHIAFSRITIESGEPQWFGLGPISVWPKYQRGGIGSRLVQAGLLEIRKLGANGCVLVGDPNFYSRFSFESDDALTYSSLPRQYIQRIVFHGPAPRGEISYHPAFGTES
ncbi:GCN5-related N-acetyltransferase [Fulvimarina pelagi HTCC2506]|uniref:GCN5-related N-acetyltransferase n=1 Tax=Fulvimarina pelagi HTCC2506 TaxID=314231 RepID=Q0G5N9_9HYPH|nr:N-acetyltransferase [Fulvimarina pelagi]EAU43025.1 GCN5-related N-acetyltransferase [Fulvimarina pelagi HTCC2506]